MKVQKPPNKSKVYVTKVSVSLVREATNDVKTAITSPGSVYNFKCLREELLNIDREKFIAVHLSTKNEVISYEVVSIGTLNLSLAHPREIFKAAILSNAASIIICHNHPSGDCSPSKEDMELTKRIYKAGKILGIELLDHVIFGASNYYSFKENDSRLFRTL